MSRTLILLALIACLAACASTPQRDLEVERLEASLSALESDASLGSLAPAERLKARQAVAALRAAEKRDRPAQLYLAERRLEIARVAAQAELAQQQLAQLERERDRILLEATRRDAERNRIEAEKLRLQSLARAEEAARAMDEARAARAESELSSAEAEAARRLAEAQAAEAELAKREAELAGAAADSLRIQLESMTSRRDARGEVMTLSGDAFASGQADLRPEARANLSRVIDFVQSAGASPVLIEGHTDNRGSANLNQALSQRRAEAVRDALIEEGVDPGRLTAVGRGKDQPVADNDTAEGRSRNRRVEIVINRGR
ncbi:OmpA family protein [Pseudomarimonas salicorniae]|uniref:OmpA family protein n=1 Tax=Pseudomarimonas salicorniae TaxID=2933270 RepID=A0ABT0GCD6_9GAMM|nr:OmpA family protein [Lysobacter sp. CAU 1642]MCK7592190.1 OmpA family protein [Lysobacter sp. CAU 1642]